MASLPGGPADKLGNEFERLWAVRHLIEVLSGRAIAVTVESLGDDERGTEFWVSRPTGTREAHQSKRENASKGHWTVADLAAKGILSAAKTQLDRSPAHRFVFVSGDKARSLSDLCERARRGDADEVFLSEAVTSSAGLKDEFDVLCRHLSVEPYSASGATVIRDFLGRFTTYTVDKLAIRAEVEDLTARWISGDPGEAVRALEVFVTQNANMGRPLRDADVVAGLPSGCAPRDLAKHPSLSRTVHELADRFDRSYRDLLISGVMLGRRETADLENRLASVEVPGLVLLHGPGGSGKSGVVFEFVESLKSKGVPFLALRADRDRPADTPHAYGESLGLPGTPAACLSALADGRRAVLIIDQIDAFRWTAAHSAHAWDTCERVIVEALRSPDLMVVVVCRTFDVQDDVRISAWRARSGAVEVKVGELADEIVDRVVANRGVPPARLDAAQRGVLRSPHGLYLWARLLDGERKPPSFRTLTDLMRAFWGMVRRTLSHLKPGRYDQALEAVVEYLDREGRLSAPSSIWGPWPEEIAGLVSLNVLTREGERVTFAHQSYLDHLTAERVLRGVHRGLTIHDWLKGDDQSLFRRGQLRQILTLLRDDDPARYVDAVTDLLTASGIRFHLQHLAMQMLGHADPPTPAEVELVAELLKDDRWIDHVFVHILAGRTAWFDALLRAGHLARWLAVDDPMRSNLAIGVCERVLAQRPAEVEKLIMVGEADVVRRRLESILSRANPAEIGNTLFDGMLDLIATGARVGEFVDWKSLAIFKPERVVRLLARKLMAELGSATSSDRRRHAGDAAYRDAAGSVKAIASAATAAAKEAWDTLMPVYRRALRGGARLRREWRRQGYSPGRFERNEENARVRRILRSALLASGRALASGDPEGFRERMWQRGAKELTGVKRVIALSVAAGDEVLADDAVTWLLAAAEPLSMGSRSEGPSYRPARALIRRHARACDGVLLHGVEARLLAYRPRAEGRLMRYRHSNILECLRRQPEDKGPRWLDPLSWSPSGLGEYLLLSAMPKLRLSPAARDRLGALTRKFGEPARYLRRDDKGGGGSVRSTIPPERVEKLSDKDWLTIASTNHARRGARWKDMGPGVVGEASAEAFSRDLALATHREPSRFARLALRFPFHVDASYVTRLLRALAETDPPQLPEVAGASWRPAAVADVEGVIDRFGPRFAERDMAESLCSLMERRAADDWSDRTLGRLVDLAVHHPHPALGEFTVFTGSAPPDDLEAREVPDLASSALNSVRGKAAYAIQALLYRHLDRLSALSSAIATLIGDPHPAVRLASTGLAIPLLNKDREEAVRTFLSACNHEDGRVLDASDVNRFLRYTILDGVERFAPLIERMTRSSSGAVSTKGAMWATVLWVYQGTMADLAARCARGSPEQRRGCAEVLASEVQGGRGSPEAATRLGAMFADADGAVVEKAAGVFQSGRVFMREYGPTLARTFVSSRAFRLHLDDLLYGLKASAAPLVRFSEVLFAVVALIAGELTERARDTGTRTPLDADTLAEVLLRLYEQSEGDRSSRRRCLDAWDALLEARAGYNILAQLDA